MNQGISLYPILKEQDIPNIGYKFIIKDFKYEDKDYYMKKIHYKDISGDILLNDKEGNWSIENTGFQINYTLEITDAKILFGPNGIVPRQAIIGVGLKWFSTESLQTSNLHIGSLKYNEASLTVAKELKFEKGKLRGDLHLMPFLFVEEVANKVEDESSHLINDKGYFLGSFDKKKIILDGEGSLFPFIDIEEKGGPLWSVACAWDDPNVDKFSKSIAIQLNKKHPDYKYLDINDKKNYNESFVNEIVYNALEIIISKFDMESLPYGDEYKQNGTVSEAVNYWKNTFDIYNVSPERLSYEIRSKINLGGDGNV